MHVAAIRIEIENRIADQLARPVIRHVAAAAGLEHVDAERRQSIGRGQDVRTAVFLDANGEDVRMLQEQQRIGNAIGLALVDQPALQLEPVRVGNEPEPPHLERTRSPERAGLIAKRGGRQVEGHYACAGSKFSMPFLTSAMNWSATAPSTRRWS